MNKTKPSKSSFQFKGFLIKKSIIDRKEGEIAKYFSIEVIPKGKLYSSEKRFELTLTVTVFDKNKILNIEIESVGDYIFKGVCSEKDLKNYFYINAPAILFPYIRAYIATLTTLSGYLSPITLPTMNLTSMAEKLEKSTVVIE